MGGELLLPDQDLALPDMPAGPGGGMPPMPSKREQLRMTALGMAMQMNRGEAYVNGKDLVGDAEAIYKFIVG